MFSVHAFCRVVGNGPRLPGVYLSSLKSLRILFHQTQGLETGPMHTGALLPELSIFAVCGNKSEDTRGKGQEIDAPRPRPLTPQTHRAVLNRMGA